MALFDGLLSFDATLTTVAVGSALIGAVSGGLGCFAYLRRQALVGDVISHAALLGIVGAFVLSWLITGEGHRSLPVLVPGAVTAGIAAMLFARSVHGHTRLKEDASLGAVLAIFFGGGLTLLRWVQRGNPPIAGRAGLEDYIFGMAAAMTRADLVMIASLGGVALVCVVLLWRQLFAHTFDPAFAASIGLPTRVVDTVLMALLVIGIVIGLQAVGVVLMIALLVTPASAARQWTNSLASMVCLAAVFGAVSGVTGALVSATELRVPTGPVIVLAATVIFVVSILFAPRRGVLARLRSRRSVRHGLVARETAGGQR